jgi:hypothetical protein
MVLIGMIEGRYWYAKIFDSTLNVWNELICFDLNSLVTQSKVLYNVNINLN